MSRRIVTQFEINEDEMDLVKSTLESLDATFTQKDGAFHVAQVDGSYVGEKIVIDVEEGEISHTNDEAPMSFVEDFRQEFSRKKFYRQASIQGHHVDEEWVSDGNEDDELLQEVEEGDVVIEASVSL